MRFFINKTQFIQQTNKEIDGNNFLVAYDVPIAKTGIQQYTREELGDRNGPPGEMVNVYRDPSVFEDEKLLETFDGIPIVYAHPDNGKVDNENFKDYVVGTVSGVYFKDGSLYAKKLTIIDKNAIEDVLNKFTNELSIGFRGKVIRSHGTFDGARYEYQEDVIHANHLALCERGKAGSFYAINSKLPPKEKKMVSFLNSVSEEQEKMKDCMDSMNVNIEGLVEQVVKKKLAEVRPKNFDNDEGEERLKEVRRKEDDVEEHMEKEHMVDEDAEKEAKEADEKDRDLANQLKKANRRLKDLLNSKNKEIRELELKNSQLDEALVEAQEYMRKMASQIKSSKVSGAMAGPDSYSNPFSPRHRDMSNGVTSAFLFK